MRSVRARGRDERDDDERLPPSYSFPSPAISLRKSLKSIWIGLFLGCTFRVGVPGVAKSRRKICTIIAVGSSMPKMSLGSWGLASTDAMTKTQTNAT